MGWEGLQPLLNDQIICVDAPGLAISGVDGQVRVGTGQGFYQDDVRLLNRFLLTIAGAEPAAIRGHATGPGQARFVGIHRWLGDESLDPTVLIDRRRDVGLGQESITVQNRGRRVLSLPIRVALGSDAASIFQTKHGLTLDPLTASALPAGLSWPNGGEAGRVEVTASPAPGWIDQEEAELGWEVKLEPGESWASQIQIRLSHAGAPGAAFVNLPTPAPWSQPRVRGGDSRLLAWLCQSLVDLESLALTSAERPEDVFLAAGSPWYLTLFGRDSIWAARMMLPLGTELAAGTLRTLARRQGERVDIETDEAPGKIMHEFRHAGMGALDHMPRSFLHHRCYYGTIDATPLFVILLAEAWRWGMPDREVAELLPAAEKALAWLKDHADPDGDGFIEYVDQGSGLVNQGWKDSEDGIQFADGRIAQPPIALSEVQAYAYQAARYGAALLDEFDRPGGDAWREWAAALRERFRRAFWVADAEGPYLAIALDGEKQPVTGLASNMGHVLGTGILDEAESARVSRWLAAPDLNSGWGLRTLGARSARFNPLSYHGGSVWTHDTAIAIAGLSSSGQHQAAAALTEGLLATAPWFNYQMPELFAGEQQTESGAPLPYPSSCHPQSWSAAASVSVLASLLGLNVDVVTGRLTISPMQPTPVGWLEAEGLRFGGRPLAVKVDHEGRASARGPAAMRAFSGEAGRSDVFP